MSSSKFDFGPYRPCEARYITRSAKRITVWYARRSN